MPGLQKKGIIVFTVLTLLCFLTLPAYCQEIETTAQSAILLDGHSGAVLFAKEAHVPRAPASMTKIMTLVLAFEAISAGKASLGDRVLVTESVNKLGHDPGTWVWLEPGEEWSLEELLIAIAVASANDACIAVAEHIAGSEEAFVQLMNQKAQELGMKNTRYQNSHGLSAEGHYMSAYDTALLSREAIKYPDLLRLTSIYEYPGFRPEPRRLDLWNTNKLLVWYEGVDGLKTGWTEEAGYCLAATAEQDGMRLISVVMGCPVANSHFSETIKLLQYGFNNYWSEKIVSRGQIIDLLPVFRGREEVVELVAATDMYLTLPRGEREFSTKVELTQKKVVAPLAAGTRCGELQVWREDQMIATVPLVTGRELVRGNPFLSSWRLLKEWFSFRP
ncbi:MAG TPA: D-alanyl-D-alanine carboxypeptidase [Firmicutes bacterium]|nr:D-alanyl-D-alanine carboxypeptidase [Bacillota bacterium]